MLRVGCVSMVVVRSVTWCALTVVGASPAAAQAGFFDGTPVSTSYSGCAGNATVFTATSVYTGYFADPSASLPKTGDTVYVRAVANNVHPCLNDVVGFSFILPEGASFAVSATNPVSCVVGLIGGSPTENVAPNYGACLQTPQTRHGGYFFGYTQLARGYYAEFRVPVRFDKKLLGIGGGSSHQLKVATDSAHPDYVVVPVQPVTVFYQAAFASLATTGITSSTADIAFDLKSYFEAGTLFIDYGTTPAFGSSLPSANVANTAPSFPVTASFSGLSGSTTYYWRARFVTTSGTFNSATHSFTTIGGSPQLLTVMTGGTGTGTVTSSPAGINCGATCTANFSAGATVNLTATMAAGSRLGAWGGACSGDGACTVTMNAPQTVTASLVRDMGSLSVTLTGLPAGNSADLVITGPDGFNITRTTTTGTGFSFSDVPTGDYAVVAPDKTIAAIQYSAATKYGTVGFGTNAAIDIVYSAPPSPPAGVDAAAVFNTAVTINWVAAKGVTYEVLRIGPGGAATTVGTATTGTFTDKTAAANTAYFYQVRSISPNVSLYSAPDLATTVMFTDPALTSAVTTMKAAHVAELRTAVNAVRALAGLGAASFTDPTLGAGVTPIKAVHITELRTALAEARSILLLSTLTFATPAIAPGVIISAAEINELRSGVR